MLNKVVHWKTLPAASFPVTTTVMLEEKIKMPEEILGLIKFGSRENMEDFRRNGTMYMNTVKYFRTLEDMGDIGDVHEALETCFQSNHVSVKITTQDGASILLTTGNGLTGQILTRLNAADVQNVFCMCVTGDVGEKDTCLPA